MQLPRRKSVPVLDHVPCPEIKPPGYLKIQSINAGPYTRAIILSPEYFGYEVYWNGQQTVSRLDAPIPKSGEKERRGLRWYGFIAVLVSGDKQRLVQLTKGAVQHCPDLTALKGQLRSRVICIRRMGASRKSPMQCALSAEIHPGELPPAPNLAKLVASLYGLEQEDLK